VIAASLAARPVHSLLHHDPAAVFGDHESMQVKIEKCFGWRTPRPARGTSRLWATSPDS